MNETPGFLQNSLIVAAHPDDELLWFGAILPRVEQVLLVFEDYWPDTQIGPARARALENFPRDGVASLRLPEVGTYGCADWRNPKLSEHGIEFGPEAVKRDLKQRAMRLLGKSRAPSRGVAARYADNFQTLVTELRPKLTGNMNVFTHNPWGEYGHEDHVQVFRALDLLRGEIGFSLWMSNYCTERSLPLALRYFDNAGHLTIELPVDKVFADRVAEVYRQSGCWTWSDSWNWFDTEIYMEAPLRPVDHPTQGHLMPLNFFNIEPVA